jgi:methionyl aminopeptidase
MYTDFKRSGIIHKIVQHNVIENLNKFNTALDIVEFIEENIKDLTKYDPNYPLKSGIGFPVGTSINDIAAHFTPSKNNNIIIKDDDLIKIDFGVHINGCITDGAFSWCPNGKYNDLIDISKGATELAIKNSGVDVILGELGGLIQEYIESKEIEIDNKILPIKSIYDLSGHNIAPYIIHLNKAVPNIRIPYFERMKENEVFAIETFPTTGNGSILNDIECNHFMIENKNLNLLNKIKNNDIKKIYNSRKTLAFCPRWFDFEIPNSSFITKYPVLKTSDGGIVAQYEKTIYIKSNGIEILN